MLPKLLAEAGQASYLARQVIMGGARRKVSYRNNGYCGGQGSEC